MPSLIYYSFLLWNFSQDSLLNMSLSSKLLLVSRVRSYLNQAHLINQRLESESNWHLARSSLEISHEGVTNSKKISWKNEVLQEKKLEEVEWCGHGED